MFASVEISDPRYESDGLRYATVRSAALGRRADTTLYAPPGTPAGAPLIVLLHGVCSSHWGWAMRGGAHRTVARLVSSGRIRPVVLAMPSDGLWRTGSGYLRHPGEDVQAWIVDEVPALARMVHPDAGASGICIAGLSMGGFGALRFAAIEPGRFAAAAGTSSVTSLDELRRFDPDAHYPTPPEGSSLADVLTAAAHRLPPIRFDCGRDDELLAGNRALHATLDEAEIVHEYAEFDGGHDWDYWSARLEDILLFFDRALGGPATAR